MSSGPVRLGQSIVDIATSSASNVLNSKTMVDSVGKLRVSNPENLIDTDFEYGLQNGKWETLQLVNNIPTFYSRDTDGAIELANVISTKNSDQITVTTKTAHGFYIGSPFYIAGLNEVTVEGYNIVSYVLSATEFIFRANNIQNIDGTIYDVYTSQLYPARVYQGTQFTGQNIKSIETNDAEQSTLSINTVSPHGFDNNTSLILVNSIGQKRVEFDAATSIDIANTVTVSSTINTTEVLTGNGYGARPVNPYDWQGIKALFFPSASVDTVANTITIVNHDLDTDDTVMYVAPVGDTAIGNLTSYVPYSVTKISDDVIKLRAIYSKIWTGLALHRILARTNNPIDFTLNNDNHFGVITQTSNNNLEVGTNATSVAFGYFIPPVTGTYKFKLSAGSNCRSTLYIGSTATTYSHTSTYGTQHISVAAGTVTSPNGISLVAGDWVPFRVQIIGSTNDGQSSGSFEFLNPLEGVYNSPATEVYNSSATSRVLTITNTFINSTTDVLTTTTTHYFKTGSSVRYTKLNTAAQITGLTNNSTYYTRALSATTFTLHTSSAGAIANTDIVQVSGTPAANSHFLSNNHTFYVTPGRAYTKSSTDIALSSAGTNIYGNHSLHKCYTVDAVSSAGYLTVSMNSTNYVNASLQTDYEARVFSPYIPNPSLDIIPSTYPNNNLYIPSTFGIHSSTHMSSVNNISQSKYVDVRVQATPIIGSVITVSSVTGGQYLVSSSLSSSNAWSDFPTGTRVKFIGSLTLTPSTTDNIYYIARGGTSYTAVTLFTNLDDALWGQGNASGRVSVSGTFVANANTLTSLSSSLILKTSAGAQIYQRSALFSGTMFIVPTITISTRDTIYIPGHLFQSGNPVTYTVANGGTSQTGLTSGSTYNIQKVNTNYIRLLTTTNDYIDISTIGTGSFTLTYNAPNPNRDKFTIPNHGLFQTSPVVYSNNGNASITGLTNGSTYYIWSATTNGFVLSSSSSNLAIVDITALGSGIHYFTATERATDSVLTVSSVTDYTMSVATNFKIPLKSITFNPLTTVDLNSSIMYFANHNQRTGNRVIYNTNGNTEIGGLTHNTSYYIIRIDQTFVKLALTYENAISGVAITLTSIGVGSTHILELPSIIGELTSSQNVILTNGSTSVKLPNEDMLSTFRIGDVVSFAIPAVPTELFITAINTTNGLITTATHGYSTGKTIRYTTTGTTTPIGNFVIGAFYYVFVSNATQFTLHAKLSDATTGANPILPSGTLVNTTSHKVATNYVGVVFKTTISALNDKTNVVISNTYPNATTSAAILLKESTLYPQANGVITHRPYDGGAQLFPSNNPSSQIIRQTRKYFRYQSGKGIQMSGAINFSGFTEIDSMYRDGVTGYIVTKRPHRINAGINITIQDSSPGWNGEKLVNSIIDERTFSFTFDELDVPESSTTSGFSKYYVNEWTDASIRSGLFDEQNGMFFEYNGTILYAVRRNSVSQLTGVVKVNFNSSFVEGTGTLFSSQLEKGTYIVIKGTSYKVVSIQSDLSCYIQPPYRGINSTNVIVSKTIDTKVPQSEWSEDKMDGTGPSTHILDIHKMQMIYIDYSWYGAGNIRFGLRGKDGAITLCHQFVHANNMTESYMRSGNIPGRYEVKTGPSPSYVPALAHWGTSVIMDGRFDNDKSYWFTASGKTITYSGASTITFSAITTASPGTANGFLYPVKVSGKTASYWALQTTTSYSTIKNIAEGTSILGTGIVTGTKTVGSPIQISATVTYVYIDKAPVSGSATATTITVGSSADIETIPAFIPLVSLRISPSVDNSRTGPLGSREIINRMQLFLRQVGVLTTHDVEISLRLNNVPYTASWASVASPSLSQLISHDKGETLSGGVYIYSFRAPGGTADTTSGRRTAVSTTEQLNEITDLGNAILGGDGTFPNGPDVLTIGASIIDTVGIGINSPFTISARVNWTEAQA